MVCWNIGIWFWRAVKTSSFFFTVSHLLSVVALNKKVAFWKTGLSCALTGVRYSLIVFTVGGTVAPFSQSWVRCAQCSIQGVSVCTGYNEHTRDEHRASAHLQQPQNLVKTHGNSCTMHWRRPNCGLTAALLWQVILGLHGGLVGWGVDWGLVGCRWVVQARCHQGQI